MSEQDLQRAAQNNAGLQQQAGLGQLSGMAQASQPASTIDHASDRIIKIIEQHNEMISTIQTTIDRVAGARPETETDAKDEGCASGQINELHRQLMRLENLTHDLMSRIVSLSSAI
jgi:hypothetical protein